MEPARREKERLAAEGQEKRAAAGAIGSTVEPPPKEFFPGWGLGAIAGVLALGLVAVVLTGGLQVALAVGLAAAGLLGLAALVQRRAAASLNEQRVAHAAREQRRIAGLARLRSEPSELSAPGPSPTKRRMGAR